MPTARLVSLEEAKSAVFLTVKRSAVPIDLDISSDRALNDAILNSPVRLSLPELSDSVKNMPHGSSIFCELFSTDSVGRAFHLVSSLSPAHQPAKVMFLTPEESLQVIAKFNRVADQYLAHGEKRPAVERLLIDYLEVSARAGLNTLIFSDLRYYPEE